MVVGTGIDVAEIERMRRALGASYGARLRARLFSEREQRYCESRGRGRVQSYAGRFAAKEAVMKALGVGWGGQAAWREIEIVREPGGRPRLELSGRARATAERLGVARWSISITHSGGLALALAVAESA